MAKQTPAEEFGINIEGFEKSATRTVTEQDNQGEWVTPVVGTVVQGKIVRAFLFRDEKNNRKNRPYQAGYAIQDDDGTIQLISERAAYKEAIRERFLGDKVVIIFQTKKEIPGSSNQEMWEVDFHFKKLGKIPVLSVLNADYKRMENELPF